MYYKDRTIDELDTYYGTGDRNDPDWIKSDCKKIQKAFKNHNIDLTLMECKDLYETYSDEGYCASWEGLIISLKEESLFKILQPFLNEFLKDKVKRILQLSEQLEVSGYFE